MCKLDGKRNNDTDINKVKNTIHVQSDSKKDSQICYVVSILS